MELAKLTENIVKTPYERDGETLELSVNIDAFTPEFFREIGKKMKGTLQGLEAEDRAKKTKGKKVDRTEFFEVEARALEINREIYAELLSAGVLVAWTATENEIPIPPSKEVLLKLPPRFVQELWELCLEAAKTVKKTTSETTAAGSLALVG